MPKARANIVASLLKKGFVLHKKKRDHDFFFLRHHERIQPVYTKISRGTKYRTVGDDLLGKMSRQLHLTRAQLDALNRLPNEEPGVGSVLLLLCLRASCVRAQRSHRLKHA